MTAIASPDVCHPRRVLGLFAKQPRPGQAKTRLAAVTSVAWAAQVAEALLLDILAKLTQVDDERVLAFAPRTAQAYFEAIAAGRFRLVPQTDGDLGQRMAAFFAHFWQSGAE